MTESSTVNELFDAARRGDVERMTALLGAHPDALHARDEPYEWTLLHHAARGGHLPAVELLLERGLDVNTRERGDNTYAMHWAAAAGHLDVVRRLADAAGDVVGAGDDHELEVIGWATCWDGCDDDAHRAVAAFLVARGARHHIFSAIALDLPDEVRRIVAEDPGALNRRMSRSDGHRLPLHFAIQRRRPEMVALLLELGADPLAVDGFGSPALYCVERTGLDDRLLQTLRAMTLAELTSAERGRREPRIGMMDVVALLALGDWETAERLVRESPKAIEEAGGAGGALHLLAKRGDARAVRWLLDHGADPNAQWAHWDAKVTPLHLAASRGHTDVVQMLLAAGADPGVRDSRHDGSVRDWAEHFGQSQIVRLLDGESVAG